MMNAIGSVIAAVPSARSMTAEAAPFSTLQFVRSRYAPTIVVAGMPPRITSPWAHVVPGMGRHPVPRLLFCRSSERMPPGLMGWFPLAMPAPDATCGKDRY
jgi:hypothetical protein